MSRYQLFQAVGVELEYAIVDRDGLQVRPLADSLLGLLGDGRCVSDVSRGATTLSNELALHVIELKTSHPAEDLGAAVRWFRDCIDSLGTTLDRLNARLMPAAMHPLMDPKMELVLWPHENYKIYRAYDRIFDCRTHGWANVQSSHLNLPFAGDDEFRQLHAAVRILLPLLPALAAASPIVEGRPGDSCDMRLKHYVDHCDRCPELIGQVIPEPANHFEDYERIIYQPIRERMRHLDPDGVFEVDYLNARGAIARFDRGSIEIRLLDVQEYPEADLAICAAVLAVLRHLMSPIDAASRQNRFPTNRLRKILDRTIQDAEHTPINDADYLALFEFDGTATTAGELWRTLLNSLRRESPDLDRFWQPLETIFGQGSLSTRIRQHLGTEPTKGQIRSTYQRLADCLTDWKSFTV